MEQHLPLTAAAPVRVLCIEDRVPTPCLDGASARKLRIVLTLRRLGCPVTLLPHGALRFEPFLSSVATDIARLEAAGVEVPTSPAIPSPEHFLAERGHDFDLVLMSPYSIAHVYLPLVRRYAPAAVAVYCSMDLGHVQHFRRARFTRKVPDLRRALEAKAWETALASSTDATLVCSEEERSTLLAHCPDADVRVVRHVVEPVAAAATFEQRKGLLFLGSFAHFANVDAIEHFVGEVLPLVRQAIPAVTLTVVGSDPRDDVSKLAGDAVLVTGWASDLAPHFAKARIFVAPLRYGAGIKIKVLDSFAHGVPVILTPVAAEGLCLRDGESALVAATPGAFAEAVIRLYRDSRLWSHLARGGFSLLERHFSQQAMDSALSEVLALVRARG